MVAFAVTSLSLWLGSAAFWPFRFANGTHPLDAALLAMLFGMLVGNLWPNWKLLQTGMRYSSKTMLPLGIVLLGARLNFTELLQVGVAGLGLSALCVAGALMLTCWGVAPFFKVNQRFAFLLGAGTAICGGSAIVALAPVLRAKDEEIVLGVASVTFVGLAAMLILPALGAAIHLSQTVYGVWAGLSIHQMPQVIAGGFAYGTSAGETATVIKLARICLLAPVVVATSLWIARSEGKSAGFGPQLLLKSVPPFVIGFILMVAVCSGGILPNVVIDWPALPFFHDRQLHVSLRDLAISVATFLLALGMAGVGWETRVASLLRAGWKPMAITTLVSIFLAAAALCGSLEFFS
jgi:uncharacterized integral membrane protein (TIGR00698 family)